MPQPDVLDILAIVRRYAEAIADGRLNAKRIATMTDDELAEFDTEIYSLLVAKQEEAERLEAGEG